jgi:nicotinamidase-related amidase
MSVSASLLDRNAAALLVIDIQDVLMPKDPAVSETFLANARKLIQCARGLEIPVIVTEQNPGRLGGTNADIANALGDFVPLGKMAFSCFADAAFREALGALGRSQLLIIGMETHICVLQTALQAVEAGYQPFVARDAVTSMLRAEYEAGLARLAPAGIPLVTAQMAIFEWLRAAGTAEFKKLLPWLK